MSEKLQLLAMSEYHASDALSLFFFLSSFFYGVLLQLKGVGSALLVDEMVMVGPRGMLLDVRHPRVALLVA